MNLIHWDCLIEMQNIPDWSIDMILCDLPYWVSNCSWDIVIPFDKLWEQYNRIIKPNWAIVLFWNEPFSSNLRISNIKNYRYDWIWEKSKSTWFLNSKKQPLRWFENICIFYSKQPTYNPQMKEGKPYNKGIRKQQTQWDIYNNFKQVVVKSNWERYPKNIIYFKTAESEWRVLHKTQKPIALLEYLIKTYTNEWDLVLDNCMGSWSTWVACRNLNRDFIGIELDEKYFEIAKNRILNN